MNRTPDGFEVPAALSAPCHSIDTLAGRVAIYSDASGSGRPLLFIHSVNAAASSKEMEPLFQSFRGVRPVYAMDLPGFGRSERGERQYTPELMAEAIRAVLRNVAPEGADIVALSLGCEFAARVAKGAPDLVHGLVLISPTGMGRRRRLEVPKVGKKTVAERILNLPLVGSGLFALLRSGPSVRYYLGKSFVGRVDKNLAAYATETASADGARFAPVAFLTGHLFTPDAITTLYEGVRCPTLVLYDQDAYVEFGDLKKFVSGHPRWQAQRIAGTRGLPHFDRRTVTVDTIQDFFEGKKVNEEVSKAAPEKRSITTPVARMAT